MTILFLFDKIIIGGCMNTKKIGYLLLTLSLILIISGCFSTFLSGLRKDKENTLNMMKIVDDEFEIFSANTSIFEDYRENLYAEVLESIVCNQLFINDVTIKKIVHPNVKATYVCVRSKEHKMSKLAEEFWNSIEG